MRNYIARRLLLMIPTLLIVTLIIFTLIRLVPGDVIDAMMASPGAEEIDRAAAERELGLDAPILVQYGRWIGVVPQMEGGLDGVLQGNLGNSWWKGSSVIDLVAKQWPVTLQLGFMGFIISQLIALPVGIISALRQDKWGDYIARSFAILSISVPGFWLGTMVIVFPSIWWGYMPPIMLVHFAEDPMGNLAMFIVPAVVLGMAMGGQTMRMSRTMMLEVLRQDYIRTAWAKGLRERVVTTRHALKNALIPVITIMGLQVPVMIGGTVVIENIFNLPGMGRLILNAILQRDQPIISGVMLIFAACIVSVNLLVDLTYGFLDPRVQFK